MEWKRDILDVKITEPKEHVINFYLNGTMLHRVFEPTFRTRLFIPCVDDLIAIEDMKYQVIRRAIKYLPNGIVVNIHLKEWYYDKYQYTAQQRNE